MLDQTLDQKFQKLARNQQSPKCSQWSQEAPRPCQNYKTYFWAPGPLGPFWAHGAQGTLPLGGVTATACHCQAVWRCETALAMRAGSWRLVARVPGPRSCEAWAR